MPQRFFRCALDCVLATIAFASGAALLRPLVPLAEGGQLGNKLEYFAAYKDRYDALFIGSSRINYGLNTVLLDQELARSGVERRSFNLGVSGMGPFEQDYVLHEVLASRPQKLRWIYLEGGPIGTTLSTHHPYMEEGSLFTERGVQWHTLRETAKVLSSIRRLQLPLARKLELARVHLELFGRRLTSLGKGRAIVARLFEPRRKGELRLEGLVAAAGKREGWQDLSLEQGEAEPLDSRAIEEQSARIRAENALQVDAAELDLEVYREQFRACAEHEVELAYFTPPGKEGSPEHLRLHEQGVVPRLFHFNDPERYPELFQVDYRHELGHLNRAGAEHFSRLFAGLILERSRAGAKDD